MSTLGEIHMTQYNPDPMYESVKNRWSTLEIAMHEEGRFSSYLLKPM